VQLVSEAYLSILRMQLLDGRFFTSAEVSDARKVAVINETFRGRYFASENPIGRRVFIDELGKIPDPVQDPWFEIIAVAPDVRNDGMQAPTEPELWIPYTVTGFGSRCLMVRTTEEPLFLVKDVAREIRTTDPNAAMAQPQSLAYYLEMFTFAQPRFALRLVTIFAIVGLLLVTLDFIALSPTAPPAALTSLEFAWPSARSLDVVILVLRSGLKLLLNGIAVGLLATFALSRVITSQLWGVSPHDPLILALVVLLLLFVGLAACFVPVRLATRVSPSTSLRYE
jgi:putative ABC transport system permease protein